MKRSSGGDARKRPNAEDGGAQQKKARSVNSAMIRLRGSRDLRSRLVLATLSRKQVEISGIRSEEESPGLRREEASFVRLMDKLTSGSRIEINETGTILRYAPGFLAGGAVEHDCSKSGRAVGWFLDAVLPLAPFCARPLELTLLGATASDGASRGCDGVKHASLAVLKEFGVGFDGAACDLVVARREAVVRDEDKTEELLRCGPGDRGKAVLKVAPVRQLKPVALDGVGLVKRVRGVAYCTRAAPALANRAVAACRGPLNHLLADVRVTTDAAGKKDCAPAPGFGVCVVAETLDDKVLCAELDAAWYRADDGGPPTPEDLGEAAALVLLDQVNKRGVCDDHAQPLVLTLMALCPEDVSSALLGPLTDRAVARLRLLKKFLGVQFKLAKRDDATTRCACLGAGYQNFAKPVT